jgi:hypothetical protein
MDLKMIAFIASNSAPQSRASMRVLAAAVASMFAILGSTTLAHADDNPPQGDVLQQAVDYVFTGAVDPSTGVEITDRKSCVVVVADPKWKRLVRYYLPRLGLDDPRINRVYSGRQPRYQLDAESDRTVVEYLSPDKKTVLNGYKSAQIPLPGDIDRTRKAIQLIAARCKGEDATKLPF